jgi:hypothetical protein
MITKFGIEHPFRTKNKSYIGIFEIFNFWGDFGADRAQKARFFRFFEKRAQKMKISKI